MFETDHLTTNNGSVILEYSCKGFHIVRSIALYCIGVDSNSLPPTGVCRNCQMSITICNNNQSF